MRIARLSQVSAILAAIAIILSSCGVTVPSPSATSSASRDPAGVTPIVVDTDMGADDILALAILLRDPSVDVRAITVSGTGLAHCTPGLRTLRNLLYQLGSEQLPIGCGTEDAGADGRPFPDEWRQGTDAAYGLTLPTAPSGSTRGEAAEILADAIGSAGAPVTVVALGPWTNLEAVFSAHPDAIERVARIHAMGGTLDAPGNVAGPDGAPLEPAMEWNLAADPSAVASVLGLDVPVRLVSLDATDQVPLDRALYERLGDAHDAAGANLAYELLSRNQFLLDGGTFLWDELAALAMLDPELVSWQPATVEVTGSGEAGGHLARSDAGVAIEYSADADVDAALDAFMAALSSGAPRRDPFDARGTLAVAWDGSRCTIAADADLAAGFYQISVQNSSSTPAAVALVAVQAPHTWDEVVAFVDGMQADSQAPAWVQLLALLPADAGATGSAGADLPPGTVGPVCVAGQGASGIPVAGIEALTIAP